MTSCLQRQRVRRTLFDPRTRGLTTTRRGVFTMITNLILNSPSRQYTAGQRPIMTQVFALEVICAAPESRHARCQEL